MVLIASFVVGRLSSLIFVLHSSPLSNFSSFTLNFLLHVI